MSKEIHVFTAYQCAQCQKAYKDEELARSCCTPGNCLCGAPREMGHNLCPACASNVAQERHQKQVAEAEVVTEKEAEASSLDVWNDALGANDGYAVGPNAWLEAYIEECFENGTTLDTALDCLPDVLWVCDRETPSFDAQDLIENLISRMFGVAPADVYDKFTDVDELQKALDDWCNSQTVYALVPNFKKVVMVDHDAWVTEIHNAYQGET